MTRQNRLHALLFRAEIPAHGFAFTRDFVRKTCLTLLDQGSRYEVDTFRRDGVRERIQDDWEKISAALFAQVLRADG